MEPNFFWSTNRRIKKYINAISELRPITYIKNSFEIQRTMKRPQVAAIPHMTITTFIGVVYLICCFIGGVY
jgi:hypothetical protein